MIHEKSCGAVIYTESDGERLYLIEQMRKGHYSMCKGHVEKGETEEETALREIREETGLTVSLDNAFREKISYSPYPGCRKDVFYFVARSDSTDTVAQEEEVRAIRWMPLSEALSVLSYESDCAVLRKADRYLSERVSQPVC